MGICDIDLIDKIRITSHLKEVQGFTQYQNTMLKKTLYWRAPEELKTPQLLGLIKSYVYRGRKCWTLKPGIPADGPFPGAKFMQLTEEPNIVRVKLSWMAYRSYAGQKSQKACSATLIYAKAK